MGAESNGAEGLCVQARKAELLRSEQPEMTSSVTAPVVSSAMAP